MLINIVKNSLKFSKHKGAIQIFAAYHKDPGELRLMVKDNGIGISKTMSDNNLFKMHGKLKRTSDENSEGTGLGLTISKKIVNYYKGQIQYYSKGLGSGASFMFSMKFPYHSECINETS